MTFKGVLLSLALFAALFGTQAASASPAIQAQEAYPPLFAQEMDRSKSYVSDMMNSGIVVPLPKDPGGGYTHEQHKRNYKAMYLGGLLYSLTGQQSYSNYVRDMLLTYADIYPNLGPHPAKKKQNYGRLFWQNLNDAVWLVHAIQGYREIRSDLSADNRQTIDTLFRQVAEFMSTGSNGTFDRIHNHATWATAGVGITGYVIGDERFIDMALRGTKRDGKAGFLRQTDLLFSPDGYYAEGPYYQRYALLPFMVFGQAIDRYEPERKIFERRGGILIKALRTTIDLTYGGYFFPFNDAIKDKSLNTAELYEGVAIAYAQTKDPSLLSIAGDQGRTVITPYGLAMARELAAGKAQPYPFVSMLLGDGPTGEKGAVAVLRSGEGPKHKALIAKNSSQGMGHGHFDKLSWQFYDNGNEIVTDYGAARFLNIVAKEGGRYLPENTSWAKQTIAHNTLVVDETTQFDGNAKVAEAYAPTQLYFSAADDLKISTAVIGSAYDGVAMTRTLAMFDVPGLKHPLIADVMNVTSDTAHLYDLPIHYTGHIMRVGPTLESFAQARPVLGEDDGYQHIWVDARGPGEGDDAFLTWILDDRFYTWRWLPQQGGEIILAETGANDPNFNLRREPIIIQRVAGKADTVFAGLLETHGRYDGATEQTTASDSQITSMDLIEDGGMHLLVIETVTGSKVGLALSYNNDAAAQHTIAAAGAAVTWTGYAALITLTQANGVAP